MNAPTVDRTQDLQIFSLTLSQLSYRSGQGDIPHYAISPARHNQTTHTPHANTNTKQTHRAYKSHYIAHADNTLRIRWPSNTLHARHKQILYTTHAFDQIYGINMISVETENIRYLAAITHAIHRYDDITFKQIHKYIHMGLESIRVNHTRVHIARTPRTDSFRNIG